MRACQENPLNEDPTLNGHPPEPALTSAELQAALHDLRVHQIELETQNETLRQTQQDLQATRDRYVELFEFAPVGYCMLSLAGTVEEVNLTATLLLRTARTVMLNQPFARWVAPQDQARWNRGLASFVAGEPADRLDLVLRCQDDHRICVQVDLHAHRDSGPAGSIRLTLTDITAPHTAQQQAQAAADQMHAVLQAMPFTVFVKDAQSRLILMNKACEEQWGMTQQELQGTDGSQLFPPEQMAHFLEGDRQAFALGRSTDVEEPMWSAPLQEHRFGHTFKSPSFDADGKPLYLTCATIDITEKRLAQANQRVTEAALKAVSQGVLIAGPDRRIVSVNPAFVAITGYSEAEILGQTCKFMQGPLTDPHTRDAIRTALDTHIEFVGEILNYRKNGTPFWSELSISPVFDGDGMLTHYVGVTRDITARKQAQADIQKSRALLTAVIDGSPSLIYATDLEGRFILVNRAFERLFGVSRRALVGKTRAQGLAGIMLPDAAQVQHDSDLAVVRKAEALEVEERHLHADAPYIYHTHKHPIVDTAGQVFGVASISTDITARKLTQDALQTSLREKSALLKEVHHRVKNNLQVISSLLRLEASRSPVPDTKTVLATMQGRIRAMAHLHESLYRSGTFASVDLGAYLGHLAAQAFKAQLVQADSVRLRLEMGSVQVGMDLATSCGLLLNELVSNCLKHAFGEGRVGELTISLQAVDPTAVRPDSPWCLQVKDNGAGLPTDFDERRKGSLGLQLVDDLARQIGGTLAFESTPGQGTQTRVTFIAVSPVPLVMPL